MWSRQWWKESTERAVKSAAQAVVLSWALGDQLLNALSIDWQAAAGFAGGGALLSYLTSLASTAFGSSSSASVVDTAPELPHLSAAELADLAAGRLSTDQAIRLAERISEREDRERSR
jgi:hypothetical protein